MKLNELKAGDVICTDAGFMCIDSRQCTVLEDDDGLFFRCAHGRHYLIGQVNSDTEELLGISYPS